VVFRSFRENRLLPSSEDHGRRPSSEASRERSKWTGGDDDAFRKNPGRYRWWDSPDGFQTKPVVDTRCSSGQVHHARPRHRRRGKNASGAGESPSGIGAAGRRVNRRKRTRHEERAPILVPELRRRPPIGWLGTRGADADLAVYVAAAGRCPASWADAGPCQSTRDGLPGDTLFRRPVVLARLGLLAARA